MKKENNEKEEKMNAVANSAAQAVTAETSVLLVVPPLPVVVEPEITMALVEKPKRKFKVKKVKPKTLQLTTNKEGELQQKITNILKQWAFQTVYKDSIGGMLTNLHDFLQLGGDRITLAKLRAQVLKMAENGEIFCERMIYDPRRKYVAIPGKAPQGFFVEFYVALYNESGERGLTEHVYHTAYCRNN